MPSEETASRPLRILIVTHHRFSKSFNRPGVIGEYLANRGHDVTMIVTADTNRMRWKTHQVRGIRVLEAPDLLWGRGRTGWDLWATLRRAIYMNRELRNFDIVHLFETRPSVVFPYQLVLKKSSVPVIIDWNDWWGGPGGIVQELRPRWYARTFGRLESFFETYYRGRADGSTVISSALHDRISAMGVPEKTLLKLTGGTRPEHNPARTVEECRAAVPSEYSGTLGSRVVGFASLDSHIDMELILAAMAIVRKQIPDVSLLVTGSPSQSLQEVAARFGVADLLRPTGYVSDEDLSLYLGCADVFVLPLPDKAYNRGRWPNKIADYTTAARPLVTNPVGEVAPLIDEFGIGLHSGHTPEEFASRIVQLLEDPVLAARLGQNGRDLAEGELAWSRKIVELENFYYECLDRRRRSAPGQDDQAGLSQ